MFGEVLDLLLAANLELKVRSTEGVCGTLKINYGQPPELVSPCSYNNNEDTIEVEGKGFTDQLAPKYLLSGTIDFSAPYNPRSKRFRYVYSGKANRDKLKRVYFTFPELAAYCNIRGNVTIVPLEARVSKDDQYVQIKLIQNYRLADTSTKDGFTFRSSMALALEFENYINFSEIENYLTKSQNLFTWITGFPIKVSNIEVSDGENRGSLYIPTEKDHFEHDPSYPKSLMLSEQLREHFPKICDSYFGKNACEFEDIWLQTIPLYNTHGVVESEIMRYAAALDRYCSQKVAPLPPDDTLDEDEYIELTGKISALISGDTKLVNSFSKGILADLSNVTVPRETLPNRRYSATFQQKVKKYINHHIGKYVTGVFLSSKDLNSITGIRNRAAHGVTETLTTDEVAKLYSKLRMLVTYLIYRDLGVSDCEFLKMISVTLNPLAFKCGTDRFKLDTKLDKAIMLPVSESVFNELSSNSRPELVLTRNENRYEIHKEYTAKLSDYVSCKNSKDRKISNLDEYVQTYVQTLLDNPKLEAKYTVEAYVTYNKKSHKLYSVILVDTPKKLGKLGIWNRGDLIWVEKLAVNHLSRTLGLSLATDVKFYGQQFDALGSLNGELHAVEVKLFRDKNVDYLRLTNALLKAEIAARHLTLVNFVLHVVAVMDPPHFDKRLFEHGFKQLSERFKVNVELHLTSLEELQNPTR